MKIKAAFVLLALVAFAGLLQSAWAFGGTTRQEMMRVAAMDEMDDGEAQSFRELDMNYPQYRPAWGAFTHDEAEPLTKYVDDASGLAKHVPEQLRTDKGWQTDLDQQNEDDMEDIEVDRRRLRTKLKSGTYVEAGHCASRCQTGKCRNAYLGSTTRKYNHFEQFTTKRCCQTEDTFDVGCSDDGPCCAHHTCRNNRCVRK